MTTKRKDQGTTKVGRDGGKTIRLYYDLVLTYALPGFRRAGNDAALMERDEFVEKYGAEVAAELNKRLTDEFDAVHFSRYEMTSYPSVAQLHFNVSNKYYFPAHEVYTPRKGYAGFAVKSIPFEKAKTDVTTEIITRIGASHCISDVSLKGVVSRTFIFPLFFEGQFTIKCELIEEGIAEQDGVKGALESLFREVNDALESRGFGAIDNIPDRRSRNYRYKVGSAIKRLVGVEEHEVFGSMAEIEPGMSLDAINWIGLDFPDWLINRQIEDLEAEVDLLEGDWPDGVSVEKAKFFFIDYDEDIVDCSNELVVVRKNGVRGK